MLSALLLHLSVFCTSYVARRAIDAQGTRDEFIWWELNPSSSPCTTASTTSPPRRVKCSKKGADGLPQEQVSLLTESFLLDAIQGPPEVSQDDSAEAGDCIDEAGAVSATAPEPDIAPVADSAGREDGCCVSLPCSGWKQIERLQNSGSGGNSNSALEIDAPGQSVRSTRSDQTILSLSVGEGEYHAGWAICAMVKLGLMEA